MTIVTVVGPDENPSSPGLDLDRFAAPARRRGPSSPSQLQIQDVVLQLPAEESDQPDPLPAVTLAFDMSVQDLPGVVAQVCDSVFVMSGLAGLRALKEALGGTGKSPAIGSRLVPAGGRGQKSYQDAERPPYRYRLLEGFEEYLAGLSARWAAAEAAIGDAARAIALTRLRASQEQVLVEAQRYLSVKDGSRTNAAAVLTGTGPNRLTGTDALNLRDDLVRIANARDRLSHLERAQRRTEQEWERAKRSVVEGDLDKLSGRQGYPVTESQVFEAARGMEAFGDSQELSDAKQRTSDQRAELTRLVADLAGNRPILFKLWQTDVPFEARRVLRESFAASTVLRSAVVDALRTTWQAAADLTTRLDGDSAVVWRYPALIDQTLAETYSDDSDFAGRVAQDRLREEEPARELTEMSDWVGRVGLAAAVVGAEPVAMVATVAQILVDVGAVLVKAVRMFEQQLGADAFLTPSAQLAVSPTYSSLAVDVFLIGLDVLLSEGDLRRLRTR